MALVGMGALAAGGAGMVAGPIAVASWPTAAPGVARHVRNRPEVEAAERRPGL